MLHNNYVYTIKNLTNNKYKSIRELLHILPGIILLILLKINYVTTVYLYAWSLVVKYNTSA